MTLKMKFTHKLRTLINLKRRQLLLLPFMFVLLGIIRIIIITLPFSLIAKIFLIPQSKKYTFSTKKLRFAIDIGRSVTIAGKYTPWSSTCLTIGLLTRILFRLYHIPSVFYIGVRYDESDEFASHAWVNVKNTTIVGNQASFATFKIIKQFEDS